MVKSQKVILQKSQKLLPSRAQSSVQTITSAVVTKPAFEVEWIAIKCSE